MPATALALVLIALAPLAALDNEDSSDDTLPAHVAERCQQVLDGLVERGVPGASAAIVLPDGSLVTVTAGVASLDDARQLEPHDRMLSGSVGKTYVTALAHHLVQAGKLDLDARAASFFEDDEPTPEWIGRVPNAGDVTLRQLLRHTSGIPRYVFQ